MSDESVGLSSNDHSFDLLEHRPGWKAEDVLVVTPYVEKEFFERMGEGLRPRRLSVIIDVGCRLDDVEMVKEAMAKVGGRTASGLRCALGSAPGLMHLKLFYIVWRTPGGRTARTLIFGSANATRQGFGGMVNAELIANCSLTTGRHAELIAWCEAVIVAARSKGRVDVPAARDVDLGKGVRLRLPALRVGRRKVAVASFDLWIQRGWLLSEYRTDPGFLRIPINLGKGLSQTAYERIAAASGFFVPAKKRLTFPYALPDGLIGGSDDDDGDGDEEGGGGNWRRKLFVWTQLGEWCSEECHSADGHYFRKKRFDEREAKLRSLETMRSNKARLGERARFLASLSRLWSDFGDEAAEFLRGVDHLDERHYIQQFDQRVERDLTLSADREFRERYLRGYELSQVPRFRTDVRGWRQFLESFVRQLCLDKSQAGGQPRLPHAVLEAMASIGVGNRVFDDPDKLLTLLRLMFEKGESNDAPMTNAAKIISRYHID